MSEKFELLRRVSKDEVASGYQIVKKFAIDKPTILVIGAAPVDIENVQKSDFEDSEKYSNAYAKLAQMLLTGSRKKFPNGVQILSMVYHPQYLQENFFKDWVKYDQDNRYICNEVDNLFKRHIMPLLCDDVGKKLPLETVKKKFRNLNIVSHSYGGIISEQLGNAIRKKMTELDYTAQEIDSAMSQISLLSMGNVADISNSNNKFTKLHIINENDSDVITLSDNMPQIDDINDNTINKLTAFTPDNRNLRIIQSREEILQVRQGKAKTFSTQNAEHGLPAYMNFSYDKKTESSKASVASVFLARVIDNSLINYFRQDLIELQPVDQIMSKKSFRNTRLEEQFNQALTKGLNIE